MVNDTSGISRRRRVIVRPNISAAKVSKLEKSVHQPQKQGEEETSTKIDAHSGEAAVLESLESAKPSEATCSKDIHVNASVVIASSDDATEVNFDSVGEGPGRVLDRSVAEINDRSIVCIETNLSEDQISACSLQKDKLNRSTLLPTVNAPAEYNRSCFTASTRRRWHKTSIAKLRMNEPLNPKTTTILDLILWNPKLPQEATNKPVGKTPDEADKDDSGKFEPEKSAPQESPLTNAAPQVKLTLDGSLVLDQESLVIVRNKPVTDLPLVEEDSTEIRKFSSLSFRRNPWRRGTRWSELETELFYYLVSATGTDFSLMHEFFPSRARKELKNKFNREERLNCPRLHKALEFPAHLDGSVYDKAKEMMEKIIKEKKKKLRKPKKKCAGASIAEQSDCDASSVADSAIRIKSQKRAKGIRSTMVEKDDMIAEHNQVVDSLKDKVLAESRRLVEEIDETERRGKNRAELEDMINRYLKSNLNRDFPEFIVVVDEMAVEVELEEQCSGPPIIRLPISTDVTIEKGSAESSERIVLKVSDGSELSSKKFVIQHQSGHGIPSSGFLHLFGSLDCDDRTLLS